MQSFFGQKDPFIALCLLAVNPGLKGVLIGGPKGTGKTSICRAAKALWPDAPFVNVPLNCSLERLTGGVDLRFEEGKTHLVHTRGLIEKAQGGVLFVDQINLLEEGLQQTILQALSEGFLRLEMVGLSKKIKTNFSLIATFDPEEKPLLPSLRSKLAFITYTRTIGHLPMRMYMANNFEQSLYIAPDIIHRVQKAKRLYPDITITEKQIVKICELATLMGVEGNSPECFAVQCAKANAALNHRAAVAIEDVDLASRLVFMSRFTNHEMVSDVKKGKSTPSKDQTPEKRRKEESKRQHKGAGPDHHSQSHRQNDPSKKDQPETMKSETREVSVFQDEEAPSLSFPEFAAKTKASKGSGRHVDAYNFKRGRHVQSVPGDPKKGHLDILATIKAAARNNPVNRRGKAPVIRPADIHIKKYKQKCGLLFIFAVDGSGSMAINRLGVVRKAITGLLEKAYVHRDKVAMIYFRNKEAKLILSPSNSLSKASQVLRSFTAGGKTPLSKALIEAFSLAKQARSKWDVAGTVLVLFTDGRANMPYKNIEGRSDESVALQEIRQLAGALNKEIIASIIFDTKRYKADNAEAKSLANLLGGKYIYIHHSNTASVTTSVLEKEIDRIRKEK